MRIAPFAPHSSGVRRGTSTRRRPSSIQCLPGRSPPNRPASSIPGVAPAALPPAQFGATRRSRWSRSTLTHWRPLTTRAVTAWVGNPPYVRHHDLTPDTKAWAGKAAAQVGHKISGLAGLHALFFLATAIHGKSGDVGSFVTSAEWLDVGYGSIVRNLFTNGLRGRALDLVDPKAIPFEDAMTTALITCFEIGRVAGDVAIQLVETPDELDHRRDRSGRLDRTRTLRQATADRGAATPTRPRTEMHSSRSPAFSTRATTCIPWRRRSVPARPFSISLGISMRHQYRMTISQPSLGSRRRHAPLLRLPLAQPC